MKRVVIALSLFFVPLSISAENKIKMVTYFPVPYVAYSKINAQKELDVGLTSSCEMNLGCAESGALGLRPLQASTVNLNRGKLDLNTASAVKSTNVTLGSGSGSATLDFKTNARIGTLQNGYSLESGDMTVDELKLFASHMRAGGEKFPSCASTGASGAPQISWQKVKLKKAEEVYLVCGNAVDAELTCVENPNQSKCCTNGHTWNASSQRCVCPSGYEENTSGVCVKKPSFTGEWVNAYEILTNCSSSGATVQVCMGNLSYRNWNTAWNEVAPWMAGASAQTPEEMFDESLTPCEQQVWCERIGAHLWMTSGYYDKSKGYPSCSGSMQTLPVCSASPQCTSAGYLCRKNTGRTYGSYCVKVEQFACVGDYSSCGTGRLEKTSYFPAAYSTQVFKCTSR